MGAPGLDFETWESKPPHACAKGSTLASSGPAAPLQSKYRNPNKNDQRQQCHHALRLEGALRGCKRQLHPRPPLRPHRPQRLRQVHLHEDPHRRARGAEGHRRPPAQARRPPPGSVRLRRLSRHRHRHHGQQAPLGGSRRARPHLREARADRRRRHEPGRA